MTNGTAKNWVDVERPGCFGARRDAIFASYDAKYGTGNWRIAWKVGKDIRTDFLGACALYEDAYWYFLLHSTKTRETLVREARDVYDDAKSNVASGLDYLKQETGRTHVQDIAIRRVLLRLGQRFEGTELIQIRDREGAHPLSMTLSPGQVNFHSPHLLAEPMMSLNDYEKNWYKHGSVEDFYQRNKILQVLG